MGRDLTGSPLRRRLLVSMVGVAVLAVAMFAIPLALSIGELYHDETVAALGRDATWIAGTISDDAMLKRNPSVSLPKGVPAGLTAGVYTTKGVLLAGGGPHHSGVAAGSSDGRTHDATEGGFLAVAVPISSDEKRAGVVRVATPYNVVADRVHRTWLLMAGLAVVVAGFAAGFALRQSARLARPLEQLTAAAQVLGSGDFSIRAPRSDVREADAAGLALGATAQRLGQVLERERAFSADVSHQLRTHLTGLLLGLESALDRPGADLRDALRTGVDRAERMQTIIDDLVRLARESRAGVEPFDVRPLLEEIRNDRHDGLAAHGRRLTLRLPDDLTPVAASPAAIRQIMNVLLDNATVHGTGEITVDVADLGEAAAIEVADQGAGVPDGVEVFARRAGGGDGHGIGLALARSLAEAEGGRLILRSDSPPVFSLLLTTGATDDA